MSFVAWRSHLKKRTRPRWHGVIPCTSHHAKVDQLTTSFTRHTRTLDSSPKISQLLRNMDPRSRSLLFQRHFPRIPSRRHVSCDGLVRHYHVYRLLFGTLRLLRDTWKMWKSPHGLERRDALLSMSCLEHSVCRCAPCLSQVPHAPQHVRGHYVSTATQRSREQLRV